MKHRSALPLLAFSLLWSVGEASSPGLAQSSGTFAVARESRELAGNGGTPFTLRNGDEVRAGAQYVRINGLEGQSILLDRDSAVQMGDADQLRLVNGAVAVSLPATRTIDLQVRELRLAPLPPVEGVAPTAPNLAVSSIDPNEVEVVNMGSMIAVTALPLGNQVAVLGAGDAIRFARLAGGDWVPVAPLSQFSDSPVEDDEPNRRGAFALFRRGGATAAIIAGGAAAAAVVTLGTITLLDSLDDDDSDDDDEPDTRINRPPASPVEPGEETEGNGSGEGGSEYGEEYWGE